MPRRKTSHRPRPLANIDDDLPSNRDNAPSPSALSSRNLPFTSVPTLTTLCARVFIANVSDLAKDEETWKPTRQWLKMLPDLIVPKIFAMLAGSTYSDRLPSEFIVDVGGNCRDPLSSLTPNHSQFLRGPSITLTTTSPCVKLQTFEAIGRAGATLHELELSGFQFSDKAFAYVLSKLPSLRIFVVR
jgi:hypothetical protein